MPKPSVVTRRTVVALVLLFALAAPAHGDDISKKRAVDAKIANLQGSLAATRRSEDALRSTISALESCVVSRFVIVCRSFSSAITAATLAGTSQIVSPSWQSAPRPKTYCDDARAGA